jgi:hypothetical protein
MRVNLVGNVSRKLHGSTRKSILIPQFQTPKQIEEMLLEKEKMAA